VAWIPWRLRRAAGKIAGWPLWGLSPLLRCYVLTIPAAAAAVLVAAAAVTPWQPRDAVIFLMLLGLGVLTVGTLRRMGEFAGAHKDVHGAWQIAVALVLPPVYAIAAPIITYAVTQVVVRRTLLHRRVFSAAAVGLSYGAASVAFHAAWRGPLLPSGQARLAGWLALAAACAALRYAINNGLVALAMHLADPAARLRDVVGGRDAILNDLGELCVGVLVALAAAITPAALVVALPFGVILQRSASHAQLVRASRLDAKTGLLTAAAWQAEAAVAVARARRAGKRAGVAVAMLDVDHFKAVNDTYGHLAGDAVLASVAEALTASLRPGDLAGRFGGEEFCVLLARADQAAATGIAERLRSRLGEITVPGTAAEPARRITVSVGVAALSDCPGDLTDLLAAADAALYRAKEGGRNMVCTAGSSSC
jgi:diguanylate cyclase (GGDEF)-like protein